jgi:hypothetical protein
MGMGTWHSGVLAQRPTQLVRSNSVPKAATSQQQWAVGSYAANELGIEWRPIEPNWLRRQRSVG